MDRSGIRSADFLATSHGGAVALMVAAKYPGRVRNLALHAPANPFSHLGDPLINFYLTGLGTWFAHHIATLPESMQALALGRMYGDPTQLRDGSLGKYIGSLRVPGTVDYVLDMLKTWFDDMARLGAALPQVRAFPALLLWGDRDRAVSLGSARKLERCFDRVEFELLPGTGHLPYEECPEALTRTRELLFDPDARGRSSAGTKPSSFGLATNHRTQKHFVLLRNSRPLASQNAHTWSNSHSELRLRLSDQV